MMTEKQMRYPCIRIIIRYMDINLRIQCVQKCPSLRSVNKAVPISARYMFFGFSRIIINNHVYQMGIYRDCAENRSAPIQQFLRENQEGGTSYDIDEYGERDYGLDRQITPGDIFIPSPYPSEEKTAEEEDLYIERLREMLARLKRMRRFRERKQEIEMIESKILTWQQKREQTRCLPFTSYLQFTITKPDGTTVIERMVYNQRLQQAMKYLYNEFFGGRKHPIRIGNLKISSTGGVLRLPEFMKVRVNELFMGSNVDEVMHAFDPVMVEDHTPEDIGVIDGECLAMNYEHPIIKAAKVFIINRTSVTGQMFHIILNNTNERLDVQNGQNSVEEFVMLTEKLARDMRPIGTCYSFGIHSKQIVKLFFKEMRAKPGWRSTIEMPRGCARFPHTLSLILNKFQVLTLCCSKNGRFDNGNNGMEPWILWIRIEWDAIRLAPGLMVNKRYSILSRVGSGSFSTVYKAADTNKNNSEVILKLARTPDCDSKFEAEVDALKKCAGVPYFPIIFDSFKLKTVTCIVESDAGEPLDDVLPRTGMFSHENTLRVGYSLMKALAHLHASGIVHMDLNDGNLTLKKKDDGKISVYLIDLGNSSPSRPWKTVNLESRFTSLAVINGKSYQEVDDLTSGVYLISMMIGINPMDPSNTQQGSRKGKTQFHSDPNKLFSSEKSWIPNLLNFCEKRDKDQLDMNPMWVIFENAIANVHPASDITYSKIENKIYIK